MRIIPVDKYEPRALPMQHELASGYPIENVLSNRWQRAARLAGGCAALQWLLTSPAAAEESTTPAVPAETTPDKAPSENDEKTAEQTVAKVISLQRDALANDGRGGFGCMAISPPAFFSEEDALDIIRKAFIAMGMEPDDEAPVVADIAKPETETTRIPKHDKNGEYIKNAKGEYIYESLSLHPREAFQFDLSFNNQSIRIEYISRSDYYTWKKPSMVSSSYNEFNFAQTAYRLHESLVAQDDLEPGVYGIFFDPLATPESSPQYPDTKDMTEEEKKLAREKYNNELREAGATAGKAALKKQVIHFLSELNKQGIIEIPTK